MSKVVTRAPGKAKREAAYFAYKQRRKKQFITKGFVPTRGWGSAKPMAHTKTGPKQTETLKQIRGDYDNT